VYAQLGLRHGGPLGGEQLDDARLSGTRLVEQLDVQIDMLLLDGALLATVPLGGALLATILLVALSLRPSSSWRSPCDHLQWRPTS
jgi:hypothetical protein